MNIVSKLNKKVSLAVLSCIGALVMSDLSIAQSNSWSLSRDMMTSISTNPTTPTPPATGVWGFMENLTTNSIPFSSSSYTFLDSYSQPCFSNVYYPVTPSTLNCWQHNPGEEGSFNTVGISTSATVNVGRFFGSFDVIQGMPFLIPTDPNGFPGGVGQVIVSWKSPIAGKVRILGRVADLDHGCGDGIQWRILKGNTPGNSANLVSVTTSWSPVFNNASPFYIASVPVLVGTQIYFVVDAGAAGTAGCDATSFDVLIDKL